MADYAGKVPAVVASGLICLAIGAGAGVLTLMFLGYEKKPVENPDEFIAEARAQQSGGSMRMPVMAGGQGGMPGGKAAPGGGKGGPGGGKKGAGSAASPKTQLTQLVTKLDLLTAKPLAIRLTDDQKAKVRDQLEGLSAEDELSDDEARKRLDALLAVLQDQKATLIEAGYPWPGEAGPSLGGGQAANPFKEGKDAEHLKALDERLGKGKQ